jgi:NADH dehydrogenase FAD-containing subunit
MGSANTVPKSEKKVVIVGGSFAGISVLLNLLGKVNVVLIDKMDYFDYICIAPLALVKKDFIKDLTIPFE